MDCCNYRHGGCLKMVKVDRIRFRSDSDSVGVDFYDWCPMNHPEETKKLCPVVPLRNYR